MRRAVSLVFVAIALSACAEPLEFADWTIPVPQGTRIIEYAPVSLEGRFGEITLVADLRLGGDPDAGDQSLYNPSDIAVADDGRIFVLESGNRRIQVFSATGKYEATIGREGQGPGEIRRGGDIAVVADRLVRSGDSKLSVWTLGGEHISDSAITVARTVAPISRLADGWLLGSYSSPTDDDMIRQAFASMSLQAEIGQTYAEVTLPRRTKTIISESGPVILIGPGPTPAFATSREGRVYLTAAAEYQVHAFDTNGGARWALRTAWSRMAVDNDDMERAVARRVDDTPARNLDVEWSELNPALTSDLGTRSSPALLVDGHGHLYVFPLVRESIDGRYPVDVYAPDGERLFAGMIAVNEWKDALGDFVYRVEMDPQTEERVVVRYRLIEPFG